MCAPQPKGRVTSHVVASLAFTDSELVLVIRMETHLQQFNQSTQSFDGGLGHGPLHGHVHVHGGLDDGADAVCIQDALWGTGNIRVGCKRSLTSFTDLSAPNFLSLEVLTVSI